MRLIRGGPLPKDHPDYALATRIEAALERRVPRGKKIRVELPMLIRKAIDEVIDAPRTGRVYASELEKTEKTYIGTKVEILVRNFLRLPKGILDLKIDDHDVDVKTTLGQTWMIPREAVGKSCILVASDEPRRTCFFGIFLAKVEYLTRSPNQDKKVSVSVFGHQNIHWVFDDESYPPSIWSQIGEAKTQAIMRGISGTERVAMLFRQVQGTPIHRDTVQAVAQQKDYMKRLRTNGGARDVLADEGIAILSGKFDASLIKKLGLETLTRDQFISFKPIDSSQLNVLKASKRFREFK
jgi:hypothetical protein